MNTKLSLIKCTPKYERYLNAFIRTISNKRKEYLNREMTVMAQLVLYGVKYIDAYGDYNDNQLKSREKIKAHYLFIETVLKLMELLTFRQFVNLFPIDKRYDGEKYMCKDYFFTVEILKKVDMDEKIGDRLQDLLWDYTNEQINEFMINFLAAANRIKKLNGGGSFVEQWAEENNISTFTVNEREGYIINNQTQEVMPYKKSMPEYLQLVN